MKTKILTIGLLAALFLNWQPAAAASELVNRYPHPAGFVNDFAGLLSLNTTIETEKYLKNLAQNDGPQVVVAIIPDLAGEDIDTARNELFAAWGIGIKNKDNGLLILIAKAERKIGIEVGYGLEGDITDLQTKYLREEIMNPAFRAQRYDDGVSAVVHAIGNTLTNKEIIPNYEPPQKPSRLENSIGNALGKVLEKNFFLIFVLIFFLIRGFIFWLARSTSWWQGGAL